VKRAAFYSARTQERNRNEDGEPGEESREP
jgi:hypothetical protein